MASPPPVSPSSSSLEAILLSDFSDLLSSDDLILCRRPKRTNRRLRDVPTTCYTGSSEKDTAKYDKQDIIPSPDDESCMHSHETMRASCMQMNTGALPPPRTRSVFILDWAATSHVVGDVSLLSPSFRSSATPATPAGSAATAAYGTHDGRVLNVSGVGTVCCDNFRIPNAHCVPELCTTGLNLVSVQQLAEWGYLVEFGGRQCTVLEQSNGKIVRKGRLHADDGLYHLEFLNIPHDGK